MAAMGKTAADVMRDRRRSERILTIPPPADPDRRKCGLADVYDFFGIYMQSTFDQPWTSNRREMVSAIFDALRTKSAQAVAAPRGEGKTVITQGVTTFCVLTGLVRFALILSATAEYAHDRLESIKHLFEENDLLLADFPEVCMPARDVAIAPQRAGSQETDMGGLTAIEWSGDMIKLPRVDNSLSSAAIVMCRGITSSLRGLNIGDVRPDLVIVEDPDDEESADSFPKTQRKIRKINQSIRGMAGPGKGLARVMLCTTINRDCVGYQYTDRNRYPAWNGKRFKMLDSMPHREDLWNEYIAHVRQNQEDGDKFARVAHKFYLDRRVEMDAGAVVNNPYNFESDILMDGTPKEVSALQHCFNIIADVGWDSFNSEYQNDPPADDDTETVGIDISRVRNSLNGSTQGIVPDGSLKITAFIDVGKYRLHYVVVAWCGDSTGHVIDYGEKYTVQPNIIGTDKAVLFALREWREERSAEPYLNMNGEPAVINLCLVDSGFADSAVYQFTDESGQGFMPSMGDSKFRQPRTRTRDAIPGTEHWYRARRGKRTWAVNMEPNYWKHWVHDHFMIDYIPGEGPAGGSLTLFGDDALVHGNFAKQICAEIWTREWKRARAGGMVLKEFWKKTNRDNHYLDCMYGASVAASVCGVSMTNLRKKRTAGNKPPAGKQSLFLERPGGWVKGMS